MKLKWIPTYSGEYFKFGERIDPAVIKIEDIAHSLSMQCRFNGHTEEFYSVAEHSLIMSYQVSDKAALYALLHDAAEAYIGDIVTPLKTDEMRVCEDRIMAAILEALGLEVPLETIIEVQEADMRMLATEVNQLIHPELHSEMEETLKGAKPYDIELPAFSPKNAIIEFKRRYKKLTR